MSKFIPKQFQTAFATYTHVEQIGAGGTGTVHRVSDDSGRDYALKLLDPAMISADRRKRFKNEILFGEKNTHKNVITIIDHGAVDTAKGTLPFYVMPVFSGSLRILLGNGIAPDKVLSYFSQILNGVEAGHLQEIVHRDLKPENFLYETTEDRLVVADWGIAHFSQDELYTLVDTKPSSRLANFIYAAPEQRQYGRPIDKRTDLYALGLILNELFTKSVPHGTEYMTIESVAKDFGYLDELVAAMIRQRPEERPLSIDQIKQELIARKNDFISRQKLSELNQTVIPTTEVGDDPILQDPIRLVGVDYRGSVLLLRLNRDVTPEWIDAFQNIGGHTSVFGKGPERFTFRGDIAQIAAQNHELQQIVAYFKEWLPRANQKYRHNREQKLRQSEEEARRKLQRGIDEEETRLRALRNLRI